jgi:hypothetical protein
MKNLHRIIFGSMSFILGALIVEEIKKRRT